jgi:hypothetical protein
VNHFKSLGFESRRALEKTLQEAKASEERRLVNIALKDSTTKQPLDVALSVTRQAGRVEAVDSLLVLIYDADKTKEE